MEYHYQRPLPERRSAVAHWLHYTRSTADCLSGGGLKPLPVRRSVVAYAYPYPVSATAGKAIGGRLRIFRCNLCFFD